MTVDDLKFLKGLQYELKTQNNEGNAEPVLWNIMDTHEAYNPDGDIIYFDIAGCETPYSMEDFADYIDSILKETNNQEMLDIWKGLDKADYYKLTDFANQLNISYNVMSYSEEKRIVRSPGAFLTKRAIINYIENNKHNYNKPKAFSCSMYKNKELSRFLNIFKNMNLDDIKIDM